ncbi:hypothetical protein [Natronoarchaeum rubrum]|uniref:hypothetical protein n=1 Tax=Natronoarchaeum rubrum TaxID=755311 RepID=UPI0021125B50|nr:hypothetical protein [Natronoarchaeum rubrum]
MHARGEYERIKDALDDADVDEPMTAREILRLLDERDEEFESTHRIATVLGREAERGEVEVHRGQPYRYEL